MRRLRGAHFSLRRRSVAAVLVLAVAGALALVYAWLPVGLDAQLDDPVAAPGIVQVQERRYGDRLCFDSCPVLEREYSSTLALADTAAAVDRGIVADGWTRTSATPEPEPDADGGTRYAFTYARGRDLLYVVVPSNRQGVRVVLTFEPGGSSHRD